LGAWKEERRKSTEREGRNRTSAKKDNIQMGSKQHPALWGGRAEARITPDHLSTTKKEKRKGKRGEKRSEREKNKGGGKRLEEGCSAKKKGIRESLDNANTFSDTPGERKESAGKGGEGRKGGERTKTGQTSG